MRITHLPKTIRSGGDFSNKIMGREGKERASEWECAHKELCVLGRCVLILS